MSKYFLSLKGNVRSRYLEKVSVIPSSVRGKIKPVKVKDMNWGRPVQCQKYIDAEKVNIKPMNLTEFLSKLNEVQPDAVILSVAEPFARLRISRPVQNLPPSLSQLYDREKYHSFSLQQLRDAGLWLDFTITVQQQEAVWKETNQKGKHFSWCLYKAGRITSSTFKSACDSDLENPSLSLVKKICCPVRGTVLGKASVYEIGHEPAALKTYESVQGEQHIDFSIVTSGFVISLISPSFGASPAGLVSCGCCGEGLLEIKCPYILSVKKMSVQEFIESTNSFMVMDGDRNFTLNKNHSYYYQVQFQLFVVERKWCDFLIWSPKNSYYICRINFDMDFLEERLLRALDFHQAVIRPQLLARWFTRIIERTAEDWAVNVDQDMLQQNPLSCFRSFFHCSIFAIKICKRTGHFVWKE